MTREEAIEYLKAEDIHEQAEKEAFEMAIKALSQEPCDDAISRDFLFRVLDNFCGHDRTITLDTLTDIVYYLPSVTQKLGWIPVSERLPEEYGEYLITWKNSKYPKPYIGICECEITDVYDYEHNRFEVEWLFDGYITTAYPDSYVIALMPLPKPYEPRESEE